MKNIVFDKTGTLTHGVPRVSRVVMFVSRTEVSLQTVLAIAGSAESSSEHPIGSAIMTYVKKVIALFLWCVLFSFHCLTYCLCCLWQLCTIWAFSLTVMLLCGLMCHIRCPDALPWYDSCAVSGVWCLTLCSRRWSCW